MYQSVLAHREDDRALLESFDITPVFTSQAQEIAVPAFPELPSTPTAEWTTLHAFVTPTTITTKLQLTEDYAAVLSAINQTIAEVLEPALLLMWVQLADVIGDKRTWITVPAPPVTKSPAQAALAAVLDIQRWLAIGQDEVAELADFAPRSVKNWRKGMDPYPATVRRLFDLHALLGALNRYMGTEGARVWLAGADPAGVSRRELLGDDAGLRSVIAEAATRLFETPTVPLLHDLDFEEADEWGAVPQPDAFSGPVRRMRHRS